MAFAGTVVDGRVELDEPAKLPNGTRVRVDLEDDDEASPPPPAKTDAEHLAALRQSVAEAKAGIGGVEARQFLKDLVAKYAMPLQPRE